MKSVTIEFGVGFFQTIDAVFDSNGVMFGGDTKHRIPKKIIDTFIADYDRQTIKDIQVPTLPLYYDDDEAVMTLQWTAPQTLVLITPDETYSLCARDIIQQFVHASRDRWYSYHHQCGGGRYESA